MTVENLTKELIKLRRDFYKHSELGIGKQGEAYIDPMIVADEMALAVRLEEGADCGENKL